MCSVYLIFFWKYEFDELEVDDGITKHFPIGIGGEELVDSVEDCPDRI